MRLANASFIHGRTFASDFKAEFIAMHAALQEGEISSFHGIRIDTCVNRSSVMSLNKYKAYCQEFQVPSKIDRTIARRLMGIGGRSCSIGTAREPVPFKDLNLVIDVNLQIVPDNVPTLLSNKDMYDNGLDISIQDHTITYKHLVQPLAFENYFLIHRWTPGDISFALYTEAELRKLHRVFGHFSVSALLNLLKRARPDEMTSEVRSAVEELTKACIICA